MHMHQPEHARQLFAHTTQTSSSSSATQAEDIVRHLPLAGDVVLSEASIKAAVIAGRQQRLNARKMPAAHKVSICVVLSNALFVAFATLWFLWLVVFFFRRGVATTHLSTVDRHCVSLHRHNVQPHTPAIDSELGGDMEPYTFGWLRFVEHTESAEWRLEDSLGVEPHSLAIYGPLPANDTHAPTAPLFLRLGTQRDANFHLAGSAYVPANKQRELEAAPRRFYIAVEERLRDGHVRELARDTLGSLCARGVH